jgi:hypothetical protein
MSQLTKQMHSNFIQLSYKRQVTVFRGDSCKLMLITHNVRGSFLLYNFLAALGITSSPQWGPSGTRIL